jgi:hypothetical protein
MELLFVLMSAAAWMLIPRFGIAFSLIAFLPWVLRALAGRRPFQRTPFDWPIAIFLVTAGVGSWAAYDRSAAGIKFWLVVSAVLLYYALTSQPKQNLASLSFLSFCFALGLALYGCLTYDFEGGGGSLAIWWMSHRPQVGWPAIPTGYLSGLVVISTIFAFPWWWNAAKKSLGSAAVVMQRFFLPGMALGALMLGLTHSRAMAVIGVAVVGVLVLLKVSALSGSNARLRAMFPTLVLSYLIVLVAAAYLGPASAVRGSPQSGYGRNSRAEVLRRGAYFLLDYPITGAGLASFPGLYSHYMLGIPHFYFPNSYNLFLDVAIEQGVAAGAILISLYVGAIVLVARAIAKDPPDELRFVRWLGLAALIVTLVHGLFYDYLYNGGGTALLLYPLGMAMVNVGTRTNPAGQAVQQPRLQFSWYGVMFVSVLVVIVALMLNRNKILPLWYANLGAVQMSQVQLKDFPTGKWATGETVPHLARAETTLRTALQYDPHNQTANYRLGLISMLDQDFRMAAAHLETAYQAGPNHRGIIKSLGYCYAWLGDIDKAETLLDRIPEAQHEMQVYLWWWETQGRPDLSDRASQMVSRLDPDPP